MIGSLMYLTSSRPDIMFAVCACARFQVNPKSSHLHAVKKIFRYLKDQPKLGLWYPKDSLFDLVASTDSDYAGAMKNPVFYSKTKHNEIRHHFIRDSNEKKFIQMIKIHTDQNVADLLTKVFDVSRFEYVIANFLNANPINYALTINPTIYTSCIKQFLATAKVKTVNEEVQIQALVDGKKVIIIEASVRRDLQLADENGTECLPNATIFAELERMAYEKLTQKLTFYKAFFAPQWKFLIHIILQCLSAKTTAWNEFSRTMASAVICLATNQKFNFSNYIFDNMVKNLEGGVRFLMYLRFVQVFLDKQVEGISKHKEIYVIPYHTKNVFSNMKRQGKDFSSRDTPLFPTMIVQAQEKVGEGSEIPTDSHHTPTITQPSTSKPQKKWSRRKQRKDTEDPQLSGPTEPVTDDTKNVASVPTHFNDPLLSGEDRLKLNELMELCTSLSQRFLTLETTKTNQALEIDSLKRRVKKLEKKKGSRTQRLKRLFRVCRSAQVASFEDEGLGAQEDAFKQGRKIDEIVQDAEVALVNETQGRYGDNLMFDTGVLDNEQDMAEKEVDIAEKDVNTADPVNTAGEILTTANVVVSTAEVTIDSATTTIVDELTLAQTLIEIKAAKPKVVTTAATTTTTVVTRPKARRVVVQEPKENLARQKEEDANIAEWDNVQDMMDADYGLAARLQAQEQEELIIKERLKMFVELMNKRKKHFTRLRAEEQRRKPPTKAQKINTMSTYLKNIDGYKHNQLKTKSFEDIQMLFDKEMKRVNTFVDMDTELVKCSETRTEGSSKREGEELKSENLKKQKLDENCRT
ncbi:hypothetical protein Tco_0613578 [Tanacetum coccineum]